MRIPFLFVSLLVLSGGSSGTEDLNSEQLGDLCESYTLKVIEPILRYVDQLQKEKTENSKAHELEAEVKLKNDLIASHIEDLKNATSELRFINLAHKQDFESVRSEINNLKTFIKEELRRAHSNSDSGCKDQLEIQNKTIVQLKKEVDLKDELLKVSKTKLVENQDDIRKLNEIIEQKDQEVSKLKEQIKENAMIPTICTTNGIRNIILPNFEPFRALCNSDIAGPGWTVIQQRINGGEEFYRNWETYKNGFGNFTGDFFLGLEKIHRLTKDTPHELYIYMEAFRGGNYERNYKRNTFYARYDNFRIAGEDDKYELLSLGTYSGNAALDRMRNSQHAQFSTFDSDNNAYKYGNCAETRHAGWWYGNSCFTCNLNGKYYQKEDDAMDSNWWDYYYSLKTIKMMIRPRGN